MKDLNEAGGINGHPVELVYKDNQGDATITAQRLDELLEENVSAVIGPFMDTCGPAAGAVGDGKQDSGGHVLRTFHGNWHG